MGIFFKKKNTLVSVYKGDPLWTVVLSQLKTQALSLTPHFRDLASDSNVNSDLLKGYQRFETFLSQIEDSYDLTNQVFFKKSNRRSTSLAQIFEDVGENSARRFGGLADSKVYCLVDPNLRAVKSYPPILMRVVDCLVRAAQRLGNERGGQLLVSLDHLDQNANLAKIGIECRNFAYGAGEARLFKSLEKYRAGNYAQCINDLGLDICAALHLASQLGASPEFVKARGGLVLRIALKFELSEETPKLYSIGDFSIYTKDSSTQESLEEIAKFHGVKAQLVSDFNKIEQHTHLVFDARAVASSKIVAENSGNLPHSTVFIVSHNNALEIRQAAGPSFRNFLEFPLTSSRILRSLFDLPKETKVSQGLTPQAIRPLRIMVVDDVGTARIIIKEHLEHQGHTVVEAFDGSEFIELIKRGEKFDLAFCDLNMVHIDGLTAVKMLREMEKGSGRRLPVALMTAFQASENDDDVYKAGVDRVLKKPVTPADIDKIVRDLF